MLRWMIIFSLILCGLAYAGKINSPPPLAEEPVTEQLYLREIYDNFHVLEVIKTAPDANIKRLSGTAIIYNNGGSFELWINDDSDTSWTKIGP